MTPLMWTRRSKRRWNQISVVFYHHENQFHRPPPHVCVLVVDVDPSRLELAHLLVVCPHGRTDDDVIEAVAIEVAGSNGIAKVGADLKERDLKGGLNPRGKGDLFTWSPVRLKKLVRLEL